MAALAFVSFFVALGFGVVLVAMRGGPRGVRDTLERGRRKPLHAAEFAVAGGIALFGLIIPAVVVSSDQAAAVGRVGPDLDVLAPTTGLTINAIEEGRARGQGQMPAQLLDGEEAKHVA